jgi:Na+/H+-dicarboxylate symporter
LSESAEAAAARPLSGAKAYWVLLALVGGLVAGMAVNGLGDGVREPSLQAATMTGGLWLDALKMTVIPLIVALLVTGIAAGAEAARAGRIAGRAILWFVIVCTTSAILGALLMPLLLQLFPLGEGSAAALRAGLASLDPAATPDKVPGVADFFRAIVPPNVIAAAANGEVLQLVIFALLFALAITRIDPVRRRTLVGVFEAIADALLVVIGWVLWIAPLGVFALAFAVGAGAGGAAFTGLLHYIVLVSALGLIVTAIGYGIAIFAGGISPARFARAMIGPQAVAISTQSSLASLPAMLGASRLMGVSERSTDVVLPLAVALFRATGPAMNIAVAIYIAHWLGVDIGIPALVAGTAVAAVVSYGAVSLPGSVSFFTSIAPIAMAMGVPVGPLALLVAVEVIPDIIRTVGNVTLDVAVVTAVDEGEAEEPLAAGDRPHPV